MHPHEGTSLLSGKRSTRLERLGVCISVYSFPLPAARASKDLRLSLPLTPPLPLLLQHYLSKRCYLLRDHLRDHHFEQVALEGDIHIQHGNLKSNRIHHGRSDSSREYTFLITLFLSVGMSSFEDLFGNQNRCQMGVEDEIQNLPNGLTNKPIREAMGKINTHHTHPILLRGAPMGALSPHVRSGNRCL